MVVLNKIYTRTGDDGTTGLGSGARRKKYDLRIRAYGTLDEVNAVIGIVRLHLGNARALEAMLARVQNDLFDVEADLCLSEKGPGGARMTVTDAQVERLEQRIDELNADLAPLRSFILPGGSAAAAYLHLARTVCRRAELSMVELNDKPGEGVTPAALKYVNRLYDFLFVAGSHAKKKGTSDVLWQPGENRCSERPSMVVPIYDDNPFGPPVKPVVTWGVIGLNLAIFLYEVGASQLALDRMIDTFSLTPAALIGEVGARGWVPALVTLATYQFFHADIVHLLGNMIFLWVFGDDVERVLGRARFLVFYLLCGVIGGL